MKNTHLKIDKRRFLAKFIGILLVTAAWAGLYLLSLEHGTLSTLIAWTVACGLIGSRVREWVDKKWPKEGDE